MQHSATGWQPLHATADYPTTKLHPQASQVPARIAFNISLPGFGVPHICGPTRVCIASTLYSFNAALQLTEILQMSLHCVPCGALERLAVPRKATTSLHRAGLDSHAVLSLVFNLVFCNLSLHNAVHKQHHWKVSLYHSGSSFCYWNRSHPVSQPRCQIFVDLRFKGYPH